MLDWLKECEAQYRAGTAHAFLLYWNIHDDFLADGEFLLMQQVLVRMPPVGDAAIIAFFNRETGAWFPETEGRARCLDPAEARAWFIDTIVQKWKKIKGDPRPADDVFEAYKKDLDAVIDWFGVLLRFSWTHDEIKRANIFNPCRPRDDISRMPFAAVIFERLESKLPPDAASSSDKKEDRKLFDALPVWARESIEIRKTGNIVIVLSETLSAVAQPVKDQLAGFFPIEVRLPTMDDLTAAVTSARSEMPRREDDLPDNQFVRLASGMPLIFIRKTLQEAHAQGRPLDARSIFDRKAKQIKEQSGGLLAAKRPPYGFATAGSLEHAVAWAQEVVRFIKEGETTAIPKGAIFIGPPGTGKTLLGEIIANEADIPLITFEENVRSQWVGESEHRLERCLLVVRANAPCIWFWDEIDKYLRNPDEVYQGDAYVSSNIHGMLLEFFSDPFIQGRVLVLGATNEPERLAPAMMRAGRLDDKVAFLIPLKRQRPGIFEALFIKKKILTDLQKGMFAWKVTPKELEELSDMLDYYIDIKTTKMLYGGKDKPEISEDRIIPITGGYIEKIITYAWRIARRNSEVCLTAKHIEEVIKTTLPGAEAVDYRRMNKVALLFADRLDCIPLEYEAAWHKVHGEEGRRYAQ